MSKLYVVMGAAGSGKSTWIEKVINSATEKHISRDDIRFSMVKEDEEYFSKEKQVFKEFVRQIDENLNKGFDVFADATHLNEASRNKLLRSISAKPDSIDCIWINTPIDETLRRNEERAGTRSYVPKDQIRSMFKRMTAPNFIEGFSKIYIKDPDKPIKIYEEI